MTLHRSRETIEAEIVALEAELDAIQPDSLTVPARLGGEFTFLSHSVFNEAPAIEWKPSSGGRFVFKYVEAEQFEALRDWLNYHFPVAA